MDDAPDISEKELQAQFLAKQKANSGVLTKKLADKINEEKEALRKLMPSYKEEKKVQPIVEAEVSAEAEQYKWKLTNYSEVTSIFYPRETAISDIKMAVQGAVQSPGKSFPLLGINGTKYLIKADEYGQLYITTPTKDPKQFNNVPQNTDGDNTVEDDDKTAHTQLNPAWNKAPDINTKEVTKNTPIASVFESIDKEFTLSFPKKIKEKKFSYGHPLEEKKHETIPITLVNEKLFAVQKDINRTGNDQLEEVADQLSEIIAEAIIRGKDHISVSQYSKVLKLYEHLAEEK